MVNKTWKSCYAMVLIKYADIEMMQKHNEKINFNTDLKRTKKFMHILKYINVINY